MAPKRRRLDPAGGGQSGSSAAAAVVRSVRVLRACRSRSDGDPPPVVNLNDEDRACRSRSDADHTPVVNLNDESAEDGVRKHIKLRDEDGVGKHIKLRDEDGVGKHIKLRWSTARVFKLVKTLSPIQKKHIVKHGFGFVFDIKSFRVPVPFLEWVMSNTLAASHEFVLKQKCIHFTKDMVTKVLGVPSGCKPVEVDTSDFEVQALVEKYKAEYKEGHSYPINVCMKLMTEEEDEEIFMRHFMLFLISTILMPGKSNTLCVEYLYSLLDIKLLPQFDWAGEVLHVAMREVRRFHGLRDSIGRAVAMKHFYMEGCLPLLAIVYADFLDLPQGSSYVHNLNYSAPRICHLSSKDFDFVMEVDRNNRAGRHVYGIHPFRDISRTPYGMSVPREPGMPPNLFHADVQHLVHKHKLLGKDDLSIIAKTFSDVLENRILSFASDFNSLYMSKLGGNSTNRTPAPNASAPNGSIPSSNGGGVNSSSPRQSVPDSIDANLGQSSPGDDDFQRTIENTEDVIEQAAEDELPRSSPLEILVNTCSFPDLAGSSRSAPMPVAADDAGLNAELNGAISGSNCASISVVNRGQLKLKLLSETSNERKWR